MAAKIKRNFNAVVRRSSLPRGRRVKCLKRIGSIPMKAIVSTKTTTLIAHAIKPIDSGPSTRATTMLAIPVLRYERNLLDMSHAIFRKTWRILSVISMQLISKQEGSLTNAIADLFIYFKNCQNDQIE